ncbi:hypothetical protein Q5424_00085 [Conexibacter sp. JD483]|uniref:hypothetical protein n=1 Tax=unclassified Conexibacter TaxID=2627773 RepID=UPI00271EDD58|nr:MULTISPECIES: hypothetical protein [unclassified Conexibacter]MDO8184235.1 hypothetical protein [Conexibacter sp. CPCC 205706]MDO8197227.1 hypothetical protein [Conexibacter sp. CPCC 205762]MDR9367458.1 hypothetical protein [Conexibacter sp. JD483]
MPAPVRHPGVVPRRLRPLLACGALALSLSSAACAGAQPPPQQPTATVTSGPTASASSWLGFKAGRWPGADWRPYAASSPFNQPIARGVRVHPRSREYIRQILAWSLPAAVVGGVAGTTDDYAHPTYWASRSDPVFTLRPTSSWGHPALRGVRIRIPRRARAAMGGDGHMTVVQPDGWEYDFWQARPQSGGVLRYTAGARLRIDGSGIDGGATAADFGNLAGIIRAPELAAGRIDHALFLVIRCAASGTRFGYGARSRGAGDSAWVYPAGGGGAPCRDGSEAPPLGARLQLAMSERELAALPVPPWKRAILRALARYGAYVGDTGGPGVGLQIESSLTYTAFGLPDPLVQLARRQQATGDPFVRQSGDRWLFDVSGDVDWLRKLRVVTPPKR